jgi:hypothetical protein
VVATDERRGGETDLVLKNLIFVESLILIGSMLFWMASTRATRRDIGFLPGIVFGALTAIAFLSPQLIIAHIAIALVPLVLGRTKLKVGLVVAAGMFALPPLPSHVEVGGAWLFAWTMQSTLGLSGLIALLIAPGRLAKAPPWADVATIIVVLVLTVIDARGGPVTGYFRQFANYVFVYIIPIFIITRSARNAVEWRSMLTTMAGVGLILSVIVLYETRSTWPLYATLSPHYGIETYGVIVKWRGGLMRAFGPLEEATALGCVLVICFTAALAARRSFISNLHYIGVVSVIAVGTLAPQSRGGMIGIAVAFVVSSFYRRGVGSGVQLALAATLLSGAYALAMAIGSVGTQISTSLAEARGTVDYRAELLRRGLQEYWKNPIFGDSNVNVIARMQDLVQGEHIVDFVNSYLYFALFSGAIGLILFCAAFLLPMGRLIQIRRQLPPLSAERDVAGFCMTILVSAAVMLAFTSYLQRPSIFFLIAATIALMIPAPRRRLSETAGSGLAKFSRAAPSPPVTS